MENLKNSYLDYNYTELAPLQEKEPCTTYLVKNASSGALAVRKQVSGAQFPIYQKMTILDHPNLAQVLDLYTVDGRFYVIEEYISGETLAQKLERAGYMEERQILGYMSQLCSVLTYLHSHKIIHRDITPGNIIISTDAVLKLIDFDISRTKKEDRNQDTTILGTAGFAAPEQFGFGQTDERTDIYAAGVLLNVLLTGTLPSQKLPQELFYRSIVERCTAIDPDARYQTVRALAAVLDRRILPGEVPFLSKEAVASIGWIRFFPGFRTRKPWKMVVGVFGYMLLAYAGYRTATAPLSSGNTRFDMWLYSIWFLYVPWAIVTDWGYYTKHFSVFSSMTRAKIAAAKAGLLFLSFSACIFFLMLQLLFFP